MGELFLQPGAGVAQGMSTATDIFTLSTAPAYANYISITKPHTTLLDMRSNIDNTVANPAHTKFVDDLATRATAPCPHELPGVTYTLNQHLADALLDCNLTTTNH